MISINVCGTILNRRACFIAYDHSNPKHARHLECVCVCMSYSCLLFWCFLSPSKFKFHSSSCVWCACLAYTHWPSLMSMYVHFMLCKHVLHFSSLLSYFFVQIATTYNFINFFFVAFGANEVKSPSFARYVRVSVCRWSSCTHTLRTTHMLC